MKICGLTKVDEALACARLGADAIGCVFYPRSPRFVENHLARAIRDALPDSVALVGVFANEPFASIMERIKECGLNKVQLHGSESPELVARLEKLGVGVIKTLFVNRRPALYECARYQASAWLVECGGGKLPGGNALQWDWGLARALSGKGTPIILAGGLSPENVRIGIKAALPDAVDVSSGVESKPGRKDLEKVARFIEIVKSLEITGTRRVF